MITTMGYAVIFILIFTAFVVGLAIGSFRSKRKAEALMKAKGWLDGISDEFEDLWKKGTSHFRK